MSAKINDRTAKVKVGRECFRLLSYIFNISLFNYGNFYNVSKNEKEAYEKEADKWDTGYSLFLK